MSFLLVRKYDIFISESTARTPKLNKIAGIQLSESSRKLFLYACLANIFFLNQTQKMNVLMDLVLMSFSNFSWVFVSSLQIQLIKLIALRELE